MDSFQFALELIRIILGARDMGKTGFDIAPPPPPKPRGRKIEKWFVREPLAGAIRHEGEVKIKLTFVTTDTHPRRTAALIEWSDEIGRCEDIVYVDELEHEVTYEPLIIPKKRPAYNLPDVRPISVAGPAPPPKPIILPRTYTMDARIAWRDVERQQELMRQSLVIQKIVSSAPNACTDAISDKWAQLIQDTGYPISYIMENPEILEKLGRDLENAAQEIINERAYRPQSSRR